MLFPCSFRFSETCLGSLIPSRPPFSTKTAFLEVLSSPKDDQPRQASWQGDQGQDPAGQESKATQKWRRIEPPNSIQINLIDGCGIHGAPCFWKSSNFYKQVLMVLCIVIECYIHPGTTYELYNMLNRMVQQNHVLTCDLDNRHHMSLDRGSIEKCCGVKTGCYSIPARGKDHQGIQQSQHSGLPGTLTCLLYTSPSPRDRTRSRMPSSA